MVIGVIFAGGVGSRMNTKSRPKQFLEMHNKPIIIHTLEYFETHPQVDAIVVVCVEEWKDYCSEIIVRFNISKVQKIVSGGKTGQLSIYNGLVAAKEISRGEKTMVLIHDGVRPLINHDVITENIISVEKYGSAITTALVTETILVVDESDLSIKNVPNRNKSRIAKAPQSFWLSDVLKVQEQTQKEGITDWIDTCTMMNNYGYKLHLIDGPRENIKITTPDDFYTMRAILDSRENAQIYGF